VKFTDLFGIARDLGADCLGDRHYVRRMVGANGPELHRAADPARDQSYFLFATTREQLGFLRFPLGGLPKPMVRELARELALVVADKPTARTSASCRRRLCRGGEEGAARGGGAGRDRRPGGAVLGAHHGTDPLHGGAAARAGDWRPGRAALRGAAGAESQRVVVGPRRALAVRAARLSDVNWLGRGPQGAG
jgi:tRNA-specific 2-thiouridylase